jgi:hypothetical protein
MPQIIEVPGHGQVEFPDGMDDDQIAAAIKKSMLVPKKPTVMQDIMTGITKSSPVGVIGAGAIPALSRALDEGAYAAGGKVTDVAAKMGLCKRRGGCWVCDERRNSGFACRFWRTGGR